MQLVEALSRDGHRVMDTAHGRLARHVSRWRAIEHRFTRDALLTIEVYAEIGRPAAVDRFIEASLSTARRARQKAAALERQLEEIERG